MPTRLVDVKKNNDQFGSIISEKRRSAGLSQFQLGKILGVSDKAVSKWETGLSRPNSKLLFQICDVLCLSPNELIGTDCDDLANKIEQIKTQKRALIDLDTFFYQKYSDCPPIEVISRFEKEKLSIRNSDLIGLFNVLSLVKKELDNSDVPLIMLGGFGSFIAYLFGISNINPLPPHYFCPSCKSILFEKHYKTGWDLPRRKCENCNTELIRDGHNIPFEVYQHVLSSSVSVDVVVSSKNYKQIQKLITEFGEQWSIDIISYPIKSGYYHNTKTFIFKPINLRRKVRIDLKQLSEIEYKEKVSGYPFLNMIVNDNYDNLFILENTVFIKGKKVFDPCKETLEHIKKHLFSSEINSNLEEVFNNYCIQSYDELIHLFGKKMSNKENCMSKSISYSDEYGKIVFRDDLFFVLKEKLLQFGCFDSEIAFLLMNNARRGVYSKNKIDLKTKKMLFDMGFNDSFVLFLESINYMFSKSFVILCVERELRAILYQIDQ